MIDTNKVSNQIVLPSVRVRTAQAGGSGTVIYSGENSKRPEHFNTYVLTCHHVIESSLSVKTEWDPALGKDRKQEFRQPVGVEFFDFVSVPHGNRAVTNTVEGEVVAYDKPHDMALVRLRMVKAPPKVAMLYPPARVEELGLLTPIVTVGCALGHDPIVTEGYITQMGDEIDFKKYWMGSAQSVFGNSGGSTYAEVDGEWAFIGIPSRIDVVGWSSPITYLGYFSPVTRVYEFFEEQLYDFLVPGSPKTEADCEAARKRRKDEDERKLKLEASLGA